MSMHLKSRFGSTPEEFKAAAEKRKEKREAVQARIDERQQRIDFKREKRQGPIVPSKPLKHKTSLPNLKSGSEEELRRVGGQTPPARRSSQPKKEGKQRSPEIAQAQSNPSRSGSSQVPNVETQPERKKKIKRQGSISVQVKPVQQMPIPPSVPSTRALKPIAKHFAPVEGQMGTGLNGPNFTSSMRRNSVSQRSTPSPRPRRESVIHRPITPKPKQATFGMAVGLEAPLRRLGV